MDPIANRSNSFAPKLATEDELVQLVPANLETVPRTDHLPGQRHRWSTNEEIASILINFESHSEWLSKEVKIRPCSGSLLLYSRKKVRYRRDGYCWKKRKDGKTTREDHMKLKVQGIECIYGCYVHSAILPTFHRRCYWLLQNPDIVLVHYLNVPYPDDNKLILAPSLSLWTEHKEWGRDELACQLRPMFSSLQDEKLNSELSNSVASTVDLIVDQLMERQRQVRSSLAAAQLQCGCADAACAGSRCSNPLRRVTTSSSVPTATVSSRQVAVAAEPTTPPLVLNVQAVQGGTSYLLLPSGRHEPACVPSPAAEVADHAVDHSTDHDLFKATFDLSLDDIQRTLSASMPADVSQLEPVDRPGMDQSSLLDALHYLDDFDFDSLEVGQPAHCAGPSTSPATTPPPPPPDLQHHHHHQQQQQQLLEQQQQQHKQQQAPKQEQRQQEKQEDRQNEPSLLSLAQQQKRQPREQQQQQQQQQQKQQQEQQQQQQQQKQKQEQQQRQEQEQQRQQEQQHQREEQQLILLQQQQQQATAGTEEPEQLQVQSQQEQQHEEEQDQQQRRRSGAGPAFQECVSATVKTEAEKPPVNMDYREGTANITDFSPEWAYPEGGTKVLVAGPWYATSTPYSVLFDGVSVPTQLVQSGVLRSYCPAHEAGVVPLQVACEGFIVSNTCLFEYKPGGGERWPAPQPVAAPFASQDDTLVKVTLMQRVQLIESHTESPLDGQSASPLAGLCGAHLEERLIAFCRDLMCRPWLSRGRAEMSCCPAYGEPSLLHLAALLGYSKLVCSLLHWRAENPSLYLEAEVDAVRTDATGDSPLSVCCRRGHTDTARLLYQWNHTALRMRNKAGLTPTELARQAGHVSLAEELDTLDVIRQRARELDRSERVFARPGTKYRSEMWRQRNLSLDLPSASWPEGCVRQLRSSTPSPQRPAGGRQSAQSGCTSVDSGLDILRAERSASLPVTSPGCSDWSSAAMVCDSSPSLVDAGLATEPTEQQHVLTLAEHIIAAMPERIKIESDSQWERTASPNSDLASLRSEAMEDAADLDDLCDYRYCDTATPQSSASPASSCLPSPCSFAVLESPSPPPSAADLGHYFKAARRDFALDFSSLTLSDREQRELYEAAMVIQKAYRSYKGRKQAEEQDREKQAAIVIQNCYRRYKQYFYYTQMTRAAMVIQNRYRTYCEHKRFRRSQQAAVCIQHYYRQYKEQERLRRGREATTGALKRTYSQRRQHQAAMKIQNFMRQSKNKLQREREQEQEVVSVKHQGPLGQACVPPKSPPPDVSL